MVSIVAMTALPPGSIVKTALTRGQHCRIDSIVTTALTRGQHCHEDSINWRWIVFLFFVLFCLWFLL